MGTVKVKIYLAFALLICSVGASAQELLQLAQKFKNRYRSEVVDTSAFQKQYVARTKLGDLGVEMTYDDNAGVATVRLSSIESKLGMTALVDKCNTTGRALGVTGFGVRVPFTRQTCYRVFLRDYDELVLGEPETKYGHSVSSLFKIQLSPGEFRKLKALGHLDMAVTLTPTLPSGIVVEHSFSSESATRDYPYETLMNVYHLHGTVSKIDYFLPSAKTPFLTQQVN
jgi:hypothetical protein